MELIRDFVKTVGIQPEHFNYLIVLVIIVGAVLAARQLYLDYNREPE